MALKMKKPWGLNSHPWLHPAIGMDLRVTLTKIKIKEVKPGHSYALFQYYKT